MLDDCLLALECEKKAFSERSAEPPVVIPCCFVEAEGRVFCSAVAELLPAMRKIGQPFSEKGIGEVTALSKAYLSARGIEADRFVRVIRHYDVTAPGAVTNAVRLNGTERDKLLSDLPYLVTLGPVYGVIEDGAVVSLCGAVDRGAYAEAHIETAPAYRGRGYAKACLTALRLTEKRLVYECAEENTASIRVAESVGAKLACRYYRIIGRK